MVTQVTLTILNGKFSGKQYTFDSRTTCIIGRGSDCNIQLPNDAEHGSVSRYHCLLDINPPHVRIRDCGSKNGTYVNGKKIGQRAANLTQEQAAKLQFPEYDLQSNDEIKLGTVMLTVDIKYE